MERIHHNPKMLGGIGLLVLAQIAVGVNIVGAKYLVATLPIFFILTLRFFLATCFLLPFHWLAYRNKNLLHEHFQKITKRDWILIICQALFAGALFNFFMVLGLRYTNANTAGIVSSTLPGIITVMTWLFLGEKLSLKKLVCVSLGVLGLVVISINKLSVGAPQNSMLGILLVLLALLPEAGYYVLTRLQMNRIPIFLMSALINAINTIVVLPLMLIFVNWHELHLTLWQWIVLAGISIASGLFYVLWYLGTNKVDAIMAALATAVMPIATVVIAWLALGETINAMQLSGMALVIASIIVYAV